tara:strand:+ start:2486 stop:2665 length:180 start_codon:yes stop_codon:yes gene_type:complete
MRTINVKQLKPYEKQKLWKKIKQKSPDLERVLLEFKQVFYTEENLSNGIRLERIQWLSK